MTTRPEFGHGETSRRCTRWEQNLFQFMFCCQVQSPMLQPQGVPVESELHVELHIADKNLQQPETEQWWECERMLWVKFFIYGQRHKLSLIYEWIERKERSPTILINSWIVWVIYQANMTNICWFQLLKWKNLLLFFELFMINEETLGFGMSIGENKESEDILLGSGTLCQAFLFIFF